MAACVGVGARKKEIRERGSPCSREGILRTSKTSMRREPEKHTSPQFSGCEMKTTQEGRGGGRKPFGKEPACSSRRGKKN